MAKKTVKRRKLKIFNFLLALVIIIGLFFAVYLILNICVKNIIVKNTKYLEDDYILELAGIKDYPNFFLTNSKKLEKKLEKSPYINNAELVKRLDFSFVVYINEKRPIFYDVNKNKYIFDDKSSINDQEISHNFRVPRLLNYVPDKKYDKFRIGMRNIKDDVLSKISDIEYKPNDYDKDRFLLYMDDGNMVYLTLTKFKMINHYNEVLSQLENHKGILYLDSGNHFQIKE